MNNVSWLKFWLMGKYIFEKNINFMIMIITIRLWALFCYLYSQLNSIYQPWVMFAQFEAFIPLFRKYWVILNPVLSIEFIFVFSPVFFLFVFFTIIHLALLNLRWIFQTLHCQQMRNCLQGETWFVQNLWSVLELFTNYSVLLSFCLINRKCDHFYVK